MDKTWELLAPAACGALLSPKTRPRVFSVAKNYVFVMKTWGVRGAIPAGAFYAPKNTPQGFAVAKNTNFVRKT